MERMTESGERRGPGRPRKFPPGRVKAAVRFTPARYADLKAAAASHGRSVSEEVEARVERAAALDDTLAVMRRGGLLLTDAPSKQAQTRAEA
jgi:hypothetical protein